MAKEIVLEDKPKMSPCPECKTGNKYAIAAYMGEYRIKCRRCGYVTSRHKHLSEAVAEWDRMNGIGE